ncbi:glycosyl hydrolase family 76-domain-containing protein [Thermothelomyces heterothallicus CBS 202.75]|uniref:glycosyl hydrolase family 76-domain-containing protein n=1 Tax=Thermothelomyces heterothallicus CBS 202.75 TaxID=1149848 RepID=UPI00374498F0
MIDYWCYTGDDTYNAVTAEALIAQSGSDLQQAFLPLNWTSTIENDDQGFWAMAAMQAAGLGFSPPTDAPGWVDLAKAVFDMQATRYFAEEDGKCGAARPRPRSPARPQRPTRWRPCCAP